MAPKLEISLAKATTLLGVGPHPPFTLQIPPLEEDPITGTHEGNSLLLALNPLFTNIGGSEAVRKTLGKINTSLLQIAIPQTAVVKVLSKHLVAGPPILVCPIPKGIATAAQIW